MSTMLTVATRLGLPGNSSLEHRFLSVDIAATLLHWDQLAAADVARSAAESAAPQVKIEGPSGFEAPADKLPPNSSAGDVEQPRCGGLWPHMVEGPGALVEGR